MKNIPFKTDLRFAGHLFSMDGFPMPFETKYFKANFVGTFVPKSNKGISKLEVKNLDKGIHIIPRLAAR